MSEPIVQLAAFVASLGASPLAPWASSAPWELTSQSEAVVRRLLGSLALAEFNIENEVAVHATAVVEPGAVLKGPMILGPKCFVASGAYLRGGNWVAENCIFGPGAELKSSFVFSGTKLAHFNFVGDSILGSDVNLEAGSIVCNYRNERAEKEILVRVGADLHRTGCKKFGAVIGDHCRIGANAVVAPGALLKSGSVVRRASLRDDEASSPQRRNLTSLSKAPLMALPASAAARARVGVSQQAFAQHVGSLDELIPFGVVASYTDDRAQALTPSPHTTHRAGPQWAVQQVGALDEVFSPSHVV